MGKIVAALIVTALLATLVLAAIGCEGKHEPELEKIVFGYVGDAASPGTKPAMDVVQLAVDELNANGGILGREVKFVVGDGKGQTGLSVEAATKLVMEDGVQFLFVEGRSEINHATMQNSALLEAEYPHIHISDGPMDGFITDVVIDNGWWWQFRNWDPDAAHYCWIGDIFTFWKDVLGVEKAAILWEDLAWTQLWQNGDEERELPRWADLAADYGIEIVYDKPLTARYGLYLPIFEQASIAGAEVIFYVSSWFTDTEVFTKQWAESAAKDIPIQMYGGVQQNSAVFPGLTGGDCLGALAVIADYEYAFTDATLPFLEKCEEREIPLQWQPHFTYGTVYLIAEAIEQVGSVDDLEAVADAMLEVEIPFGLGYLSFESRPIKPFYHSRVIVANPEDPFEPYPGKFAFVMGQYQLDGEWVPIYTPEWSLGYPALHQPGNYTSPAELRVLAGG